MTTRPDLRAIRRRLADLRDSQQPGTDIASAAAAALACAHDVDPLIAAYTAADDAWAAAERDVARLVEANIENQRRIATALKLLDAAADNPAKLRTLPYDLPLVLQAGRDTAAAA